MNDKVAENKSLTKDREIGLSEEDKNMLVNTINKKGFFLEEKAFGVLDQREGLFLLRKNFIPENYNLKFNDDRIEIDLVFMQDNKNLIIECKKTDFAWIFPKSLVGSPNVNYMYEHEDGMRVRSYKENKWKVCYSEPMEIMMNDDGTLVPHNHEKKFVKTQSRQEDPIHRAVKRVLHQTKAWRWEPDSKKEFKFFVPIILTNAPLFFLDYDPEQIDKDSNITDYNSLEKIDAVIYNYPEILNWPNAKEEREIKSVFIVNINHFTDFLDWIMEQDLIVLEGMRKLAT
jgi:hypothetical protein